MFSKNYESDIDISDSDFQIAESHLYYFYTTIKEMQKYIEQNKNVEITDILEDDISKDIIPNFINVMDDDFNTASAISYLYGIFKYVNNAMKTAKKGNKAKAANTLENILKNVKEVYGVLGLFKQEPEKIIAELKEKYLNKLDISKQYIEEQITKRLKAKKERNFELADEIRAELDEKGIILNDTVNGTTWDVKALYKIS